jgi:hypothetical protein
MRLELLKICKYTVNTDLQIARYEQVTNSMMKRGFTLRRTAAAAAPQQVDHAEDPPAVSSSQTSVRKSPRKVSALSLSLSSSAEGQTAASPRGISSPRVWTKNMIVMLLFLNKKSNR